MSTNMSIQDRIHKSFMIQGMFPEFVPLAELGMDFLGFRITPMQSKVAEFNPRLFVGAPRGLGKSFLFALRAVWTWINKPTARVLIVSGATDAKELVEITERAGNLIEFVPRIM